MQQALPRAAVHRLSFHAALGLLLIFCLLTAATIYLSSTTGILRAHRLLAPEVGTPSATAQAPAEAEQLLFRDWPQRAPDLVLVLSGQQHGFLHPCGCSKPQYGGLQRRHNFIKGLQDRGWPVLGVDLGDLLDTPQHRGPQSLLKYQTSMKALKLMNYLAVGLGQSETEMPLIDTLGQYALNDQSPRIVAANLRDKDANFPDMLGSWVVQAPPQGKLKLGVTGIIGPTVRAKIPQQNPPLQFNDTTATLNAVLKDMQAEKPDVRLLLYQGNQAEANECARHFPQFQVILCLTRESEPSDKPERINNTWVVGVGQKARYVGVVGLWRTANAAQPFEMRYQLAMLGEEYETKPGQEKANPVLQLLEDYTRQVKDGNYLEKYTQRKHPVQVEYPDAKYVGSDECISCHRHAFQVWKGHPHSHAYQTLVDARRPELRQFDGECIVCHTVGFGFESGYVNEPKTAHLKDVGCESCHGPGSLHAEQGKKTPGKMLALMNPFKPQPNETPEQEAQRLLRLDLDCQKCHDVDNDVKWSFKKKWPAVIHRTPRN